MGVADGTTRQQRAVKARKKKFGNHKWTIKNVQRKCVDLVRTDDNTIKESIKKSLLSRFNLKSGTSSSGPAAPSDQVLDILPTGWKTGEHEGRTYYIPVDNNGTPNGSSQWERPRERSTSTV